jgi:hypothetical protein
MMLLAAALASLLATATLVPPKETPLPDEEGIARQMAEVGLRSVDKSKASGGVARRDQHAKQHGCVRGTLTVDPARPLWTQFGLFAKAGSYKVWARLSNASPNVQDDGKGDARGAALKIIGVPGPKLLSTDAQGHNMDLLFFTEPALFTKDAKQLLEVQRMLAGEVNALFYSVRHPVVTGRVVRTAIDGAKIKDPFAARYYTAAPYRYGPGAVKLQLRPCTSLATSGAKGPDALKQAMAKHVDTGKACFDLLVQLFASEQITPIEDFSKVWDEKIAQPTRVAQITFAKQAFDNPAQQAFCENLSFNPWRTIEDHRPLGNLNRVRRMIYESISKHRHELNGAARAEPTGDETF